MSRPSPQTMVRRKAEKLLEMFIETGLAVGGVKVEGKGDEYTITILTPEGARSEMDEFEKWKQGQDAA